MSFKTPAIMQAAQLNGSSRVVVCSKGQVYTHMTETTFMDLQEKKRKAAGHAGHISDTFRPFPAPVNTIPPQPIKAPVQRPYQFNQSLGMPAAQRGAGHLGTAPSTQHAYAHHQPCRHTPETTIMGAGSTGDLVAAAYRDSMRVTACNRELEHKNIELQCAVDCIHGELEACKTELAARERKMAEYEKMMAELQAQLGAQAQGAVSVEADRLRQEVCTLREQKAAMEELVKQQDEVQKQRAAIIRRHEDQEAKLRAELAKARETHVAMLEAQAGTHKIALRQKVDELTDEFTAKEAAYEVQVSALGEDNHRLKLAYEQEVASLQERLTQYQSEVTRLTQERKQAQVSTVTISGLEAKVAELETKAAEMTTQRGELEAKVAELETKAAEMTTQRSELEAKAAEMTNQHGELEAKVAELETKAAEMTTQRSELEAKVAEMTTQRGELEVTMTSSEKWKKVYKRVSEKRKAKWEAAKKELRDIKGYFQAKEQAHQEQLAALRQLVDDLTTQSAKEKAASESLVSDLTAELNKLQLTLDSAQAAVVTSERQMTSMEAELAQLKTGVTRLTEERDKYKGLWNQYTAEWAALRPHLVAQRNKARKEMSRLMERAEAAERVAAGAQHEARAAVEWKVVAAHTRAADAAGSALAARDSELAAVRRQFEAEGKTLALQMQLSEVQQVIVVAEGDLVTAEQQGKSAEERVAMAKGALSKVIELAALAKAPTVQPRRV